jgi:predicted ABC-type ATPase
MLTRIRELVGARQSFAFESTLAGRSYKADGWRVTLVYLWLPSPPYAIERVARRVQQGGHNIPSDVIERRYRTGLSNMLRLYLPLADVAGIYDNSDGGRRLVAFQRERDSLIKRDTDRWSAIQTWAERAAL